MKRNMHIILVEPQHSGNLGAAARAMLNMGLKKLKLVQPQCDPLHMDAIKMALNARTILEQATIHASLEEAVQDQHLVIGTSRRTRRRFYPTYTPRDLATRLREYQEDSQIALVFGREDKGLSNEELALCQMMASIPANPEAPSLNLAQAVLLFTYEIFLLGQSTKPIKKAPAPVKELEGMYRQLEEVLLQIRFINRGDPKHMMQSIRNIFGRSELLPREVRIIRGISATVRYVARRAGF